MENNFFKQVGDNIQSVLVEKNVSQQYLADKLNISKQVMSKIILGAKAINVAEIAQIASTLNVPVGRLLNINGNQRAEHNFSFMDRVKNEKTKEQIEFIKTVIDQIIMLEDYASAKEKSPLSPFSRLCDLTI